MMDEVRGAVEDGISSIELFPAIDEALKTSDGKECYNPDGLVPRAIGNVKKEFQTWLSLQTWRWTHIRRMVTMAL